MINKYSLIKICVPLKFRFSAIHINYKQHNKRNRVDAVLFCPTMVSKWNEKYLKSIPLKSKERNRGHAHIKIINHHLVVEEIFYKKC